MALSSSSDCMGFSKALPLQADSLKHLSSLQRRIVKGAVEQSGEASSGPSPVCPVVVSLPGRDSDFDQRSGMDIFQPQHATKVFGALSHASDSDANAKRRKVCNSFSNARAIVADRND
jgi:hypothetical protein